MALQVRQGQAFVAWQGSRWEVAEGVYSAGSQRKRHHGRLFWTLGSDNILCMTNLLLGLIQVNPFLLLLIPHNLSIKQTALLAPKCQSLYVRTE